MSRRRSTRTTPTRAASTQIGSTCRRARARIRPRARPAPAGSHRSQLVAAVVSGALAGAAVHVARLCRLCARLPAPPGAGRTARRLSPAATPPPHVFYGAYDGCGRVVVSSCCAGGWWNGQVRRPGQQCCRAGGARAPAGPRHPETLGAPSRPRLCGGRRPGPAGRGPGRSGGRVASGPGLGAHDQAWALIRDATLSGHAARQRWRRHQRPGRRLKRSPGEGRPGRSASAGRRVRWGDRRG
jgi:hypothetical protein